MKRCFSVLSRIALPVLCLPPWWWEVALQYNLTPHKLLTAMWTVLTLHFSDVKAASSGSERAVQRATAAGTEPHHFHCWQMIITSLRDVLIGCCRPVRSDPVKPAGRPIGRWPGHFLVARQLLPDPRTPCLPAELDPVLTRHQSGLMNHMVPLRPRNLLIKRRENPAHRLRL